MLVRIAAVLGLVAFAACSSQPPAEFRVDRGQLPICGVHTSQPVIGLSFDGGPGPYTDADLQLVRSVGAKATFFVTAKHMADYPDGVVHELADGMDVENHTWSHPVMPLLPVRSQRSELTRTQAALVAAGAPAPTLWRPPYGAADHGTLEIASRLGLRPILWERSVEIKVRYPNPDPHARAEELAGELVPGEILLAHDSIPLASTTQTLQFLLPMLRDKGYRLVSIPELLASGSPVLGYARWGTEIDGHPVMRGGCPPAWPAPVDVLSPADAGTRPTARFAVMASGNPFAVGIDHRKGDSKMNRGAGTGLIAFGLVLVVLGAILDFAVNVTASGFSINTVGVILLIVGIVAFLAGLVIVFTAGSRRSVIREDVRQVPGGTSRVIDERDNLAS